MKNSFKRFYSIFGRHATTFYSIHFSKNRAHFNTLNIFTTKYIGVDQVYCIERGHLAIECPALVLGQIPDIRLKTSLNIYFLFTIFSISELLTIKYIISIKHVS